MKLFIAAIMIVIAFPLVVSAEGGTIWECPTCFSPPMGSANWGNSMFPNYFDGGTPGGDIMQMNQDIAREQQERQSRNEPIGNPPTFMCLGCGY